MSFYLSEFTDPVFIDHFGRRMDRLFKHFEQPSSQGALTTQQRSEIDYAPNLDVSDTPKQITLHAELPGLKKEDIKIEAHGGHLTISGENKDEKDYEEGSWHIRERKFGKFQRSVRLPKNADFNAVSAKYDNGVLEVVVPKLANVESERKAIAIQ